jgi:hypothetical protein
MDLIEEMLISLDNIMKEIAYLKTKLAEMEETVKKYTY